MRALSRRFNAFSFTPESYAAYKQSMYAETGASKVRLCETPVLLSKSLFDTISASGKEIIEQAMQPKALERVKALIPAEYQTTDLPQHPTVLAVDFAITKDASGHYKPMLIEMQAFSSIYAFMLLLSEQSKKAYALDDRYQFHPQGKNLQDAVADLREALVGPHDPKNVVLIDIDPWNQTTVMDFRAVQKLLGVNTVDVRDVIKKGDRLYYTDADGNETRIKRIYNRVIPEEFSRLGLQSQVKFNFMDKLDVEWVEHPNWFFLISKASMPSLKHPHAPNTFFVSDLSDNLPEDLENYVLKPLFAFAGAGVKIDVTKEDLDAIPAEKRGEFILQRKVNYDPFIENPEGLTSKAEVRVMYLWTDELRPAIMLGRVSRGKLSNMTGARFTEEDNWIGMAPVLSVETGMEQKINAPSKNTPKRTA